MRVAPRERSSSWKEPKRRPRGVTAAACVAGEPSGRVDMDFVWNATTTVVLREAYGF
jgi:hypothetical protein